MKILFTTAALALASTTALSGGLEPTCQPYTEARAALGAEGEKVLWSGRTNQDIDIIVLVQSDGQTFTILEKEDRLDPNGETCLLFHGTANKLAPAFQLPAEAAAPLETMPKRSHSLPS